eukprot:Nk52_evm17s212 gene=Nk52_evmTU17s212
MLKSDQQSVFRQVVLLLLGVYLVMWASFQPCEAKVAAPGSGVLNPEQATIVYQVMLHYQFAGLGSEAGLANCDFCKTPLLSKFEDIEFMDDGIMGDVAVMGYNSEMDAIIVAWRGSSNVQNWINNIDFFQTTWKDDSSLKVHKGFKRSVFSGVQKQVITNLETMLDKHPKAKLFITGHSLGAAQASLSALDIAEAHPEMGDRVTYVILMASPLVGNKAFTQHFMKVFPDVVRVNNKHDPVPLIPPAGKFLFYDYARLGGDLYMTYTEKEESKQRRGADDSEDNKDEDEMTVDDITSEEALEKYIQMIKDKFSANNNSTDSPSSSTFNYGLFKGGSSGPGCEVRPPEFNYFTTLCNFDVYSDCEAMESLLKSNAGNHDYTKYMCNFKKNEPVQVDY